MNKQQLAERVLAAARKIADKLEREICELPDRTSPDDMPDMMLVTGKELRDLILDIVTTEITESLSADNMRHKYRQKG